MSSAFASSRASKSKHPRFEALTDRHGDRRAVEIFKEDLNLARFSLSCGPLTQAFKSISERVRQVELKLSTPSSKEAVVEETQVSLGPGLGLKDIAQQVREV